MTELPNPGTAGAGADGAAGAPTSANAKQRVEVLNEAGLHARPAAVLAQCALGFQSDIVLELVAVPEDLGVSVGTRVDAKSIMDVLFLAAPCGTQIDVEATGDDAEASVTAIAELFQSKFGIAS